MAIRVAYVTLNNRDKKTAKIKLHYYINVFGFKLVYRTRMCIEETFQHWATGHNDTYWYDKSGLINDADALVHLRNNAFLTFEDRN
ncbi:MAG: hypothetical protein ACRC3J_01835 [Culicoidibacterales bacterium]